MNEEPKFIATTPTLEHHSIYISDGNIRLPMALSGIISYFPTQLIAVNEINNRAHNSELTLEVAPKFSEWYLHNLTYGNQENFMMNNHSEIITPKVVSDVNTGNYDNGCSDPEVSSVIMESDRSFYITLCRSPSE